jgi:hypothetical protein
VMTSMLVVTPAANRFGCGYFETTANARGMRELG